MERLPGGLSFWLLRPCGNCLARPELPGAKPSLERMAASLISRTAATSAGNISSMVERVTTSRNRRGNAGINRSNASTTSRPATVSSAGITAERSCANFSPVSSNEVSGHLRFRSTATARQSVRASTVDHPPQPVSAALAGQQGTFPGWCPRIVMVAQYGIGDPVDQPGVLPDGEFQLVLFRSCQRHGLTHGHPSPLVRPQT